MKYNGKRFLSDLKFYNDYSKWNDEHQRYETWEESCIDVMSMHREKYQGHEELIPYIDEAEEMYKNKEILASQRTLQFRKQQIFSKNERMYNCVATYLDDIDKIHKSFYLSLCGCGITLNMCKKWTSNLPNVIERDETKVKNYIIPDSIEGWADSVGVLLSSFCDGEVPFPEYQGCIIRFDYSNIRPQGSLISGGFKAPGHEGLKQSIENIEKLLSNITPNTQLKTIDAYDCLMHCADATLSGGVRRAAMAVIIDPNDEDMLNAKVGDWRGENKQRERSNNSVLMKRGNFSKKDLEDFIKVNSGMSDIGFVFSDTDDIIYNPCVTGDTVIELAVKNANGTITQWKERIEDSAEKFETEHYTKNDGIRIRCYNVETQKHEFMPFDNIILTKYVSELIEIECEGKKITVTPEHKIYTSNRGYVEAQELKEDDKLVLI